MDILNTSVGFGKKNEDQTFLDLQRKKTENKIPCSLIGSKNNTNS